MSGVKSRIDVLSSYEDFKKGEVLLTTDGGATFLDISPEKKEVHPINPTSLERDFSGRMKGVSVGTPTVERSAPQPGEQQLRRTYTLSARRFLVRLAARAEDTFQFWEEPVAGPASGAEPSYNPVANLLVLEHSKALCLRAEFRTGGLAASLPGGMVTKAVLETHLRGAVNRDETITMTTSNPVASPFDDGFFDVPNGYAVK